MNPMDRNDSQPYELELAELLASNLSNKEMYVERLQDLYSKDAKDIAAIFETWKDLGEIDVPSIRPQMDDAFYGMLDTKLKRDGIEPIQNIRHDESLKPAGISRWLNPTKFAIAATFVLGMIAGNWIDFGGVVSEKSEVSLAAEEDSRVQFASLEKTPSAMKRIKGIHQVKDEENPDLKIIDALNKVIINDPNVNVRLIAIETMVAFSHIPEARAYLIEAIPHQDSPIVQLELADVMIALEEKSSADKWNQLLQSENIETETRIHLKESLRTIL